MKIWELTTIRYNMGKKYNANKLEILIERRNPSNSELHP
jgi:hypothetical protein